MRMDEKKCYGCQTVKSSDNFCKDRLGVGGLKNYCRECQRLQRKAQYDKNKDRELSQGREYKKKNALRIGKRRKLYLKQNPDKLKQWKRSYYLKRRANPKNRLDDILAHAIKKRIRFSREMGTWKDILGYTIDELMTHLESRFTTQMSWDNYGSYWHIDHIRPKSWYEYDDIADTAFRECWSLTNLQPLEATLNCSKQDRYEG